MTEATKTKARRALVDPEAVKRARGSWRVGGEKWLAKESAKRARWVREIPATPDRKTIEKYCRTLIPRYDPWRDAAGYEFDSGCARRAIEWFHTHLTHVKGELGGQAFRLEPWQMAILGNLFGWHSHDRTRRYRTVFIFVPRKNGKTPMAAGLALYLFVEDREPGAEIYSAASMRDQARLVWLWAKGMIYSDEMLDSACRVYQHSIVLNADEMSCYKPMAAEASSLHGANLHGAIVDELHTFSTKNEEVIDVLETSTAARRQPMVVYISTAGWDRNSICYHKYNYAARVRDGQEGWRDATFLPVVHEALPDDDWTDESIWRKANPNLGVSVKEEYFRREFARATKDAAYENRFRQLHLNQWTEQAVRWLRMKDWDRGDEPAFVIEDLHGRTCYGGLDLAITRDLTALGLVFPDDDGGFTVAAYHWIPAENAKEREERDKVPYRKWEKMGLCELTPGNVTDMDYIERRILEIKDRFDLKCIGFDPWRARAWSARFGEKHGVPMVEIPQGIIQISEPAQNFHKAVAAGRLRHAGNPMLRWQAGNVVAYVDVNDNVKPKKSSDTNRIDGIIALIMAMKLALTDLAPKSVYEDRGLLELEL